MDDTERVCSTSALTGLKLVVVSCDADKIGNRAVTKLAGVTGLLIDVAVLACQRCALTAANSGSLQFRVVGDSFSNKKCTDMTSLLATAMLDMSLSFVSMCYIELTG